MTVQVSQSISQLERRIYNFFAEEVGSQKMLGWVLLLHNNVPKPNVVIKSRFNDNMVYKRDENNEGKVLASSGQLAIDVAEIKNSNDDCMFVCNAVKCPSEVSSLLDCNLAKFLADEKLAQRNISTIAGQLLRASNVSNVGEMLCFSEDDLSNMRNIGDKMLSLLKQSLEENHGAKIGMFSSNVHVPTGSCVIELVAVIEE